MNRLVQGRAEGRAEGEAAKAQEIAKRLRSVGLNPEQIAQATGLTIEAIAAL